MGNRELTYRVSIVTSDARRQAPKVRSIFENELRTITLGKLDTSSLKTGVTEAQKLRAEIERATVAMHQMGQASGAVRVPSAGGGIGGFFTGQVDDALNQLKGLAAGYLGLQGVIAGINEVIDLTALNTQAQRANKSFDILSGGAEKAAVNVSAIQSAAGGAVVSLDAIAIGNQAASLGLAKTTAGFAELAQAARIITQVSPVIRDQSEALTQLALFSSNAASYARADQLGLAATEVRERIQQLRSEYTNLDDSQLKLLASTQLLNEKFGALLTTSEAQASGLERLTANYNELRIAIAASAGPVDAIAGTFASAFSQATTNIAGTDTPLQTLLNNLKETERISRAISELSPVKNLLPESVLGVDADTIAQDIVKGLGKGLDSLGGLSYFIPETVLGGLDAGTILGDPEKIKQVTTALEVAASAVSAGIPGANEFFNEVSRVAVAVDQQNFATAEQVALVGQLTAAYQQQAQAGGEAFAQQQQQAQAAAQLEEQRLAKIFEQQEAVNQALASRATKAAPEVGIEQAIALYREQKLAAEAAIDQMAATGVSDANEIAIRTSEIVTQLLAPFDALEERASTLDIGQYTANFYEVGDALAGFNASFVDALPGLSAMRDDLISISNEMSVTGAITAEQAAELDYLGAAADAVSGSTSGLSSVVASLGIEFLLTNENAAATVDQMFLADVAFANGQISADIYAGIISVLSGRLLTLADDAGIATAAIANLNAAQVGKFNVAGLNAGQAVSNRLDVQEGVRQRETARREQERAARETERAFGRAARNTEKAFNDAAKQLQSDLRSVPGLFKRSAVTSEQMDLANAGITQAFADDFLRRAEDEFKNGVDWPEVDLADVARRVGLDPSLPAEQIFNELVSQWESGALFADKSNLELINKEAVDKALELQEKARQGQENILEFFGAQVDSAVAAITGSGGGGGGGGGGAITIDTSGAEAAAQATALALTPTLDTAAIQAQLDALQAPTLAGVITFDTAGIQAQLDALSAPTITATLGLDAANIITINGVIGALTPTIAPTLSASPESLATFATYLETNIPTPGIEAHLTATVGTMSDFTVYLQDNIPTPGVQAALAVTIEEIQLFEKLVSGLVHPTVTVDLATQQQQTNEDGGQGANAITPLLQSINTQTRASADGIMREGATIAQILMAGLSAYMKGQQSNGEQVATPFADALMTNVSTQFSAAQGMFYAVGFLPAQSVESGFKGYGYTGLTDGILDGLTTGIRANADAYMQRGATIAGYVQAGMNQQFSADAGVRSAISAGAAWGSAFMQGVFGELSGAGFVDQISTQVIDGITGELQQP